MILFILELSMIFPVSCDYVTFVILHHTSLPKFKIKKINNK